MWGFLPVRQRVQPDSSLALQAVTVCPALRADGDSPAGTTGAPVTRISPGGTVQPALRLGYVL